MTRRAKIWLLLSVGLGLGAWSSLRATLTLDTSTNSVSIPVSATDYNPVSGAAQIIAASAQTLTIVSDKKTWTVSMQTLTSTFAFTPSRGDPNPNKPASDLSVRVPATSLTWIPLSTASQVLATGPKQLPPQDKTLDYRLNSNLSNNPPGTYTISIVYTLTVP